MEILSGLAYGVDVPMYSAIYQALTYVAGPLAPYLCGFIIVGFLVTFYTIANYIIPYLFNSIKYLFTSKLKRR